MLYANGYPVGGGGGGSTEIIADDFDATSTYAVGDYVVYDGILYKCTTAVSTAGQWDANDWTETIVMDEVGGGGTGGHTIIDENGNSMTARAGLQFVGGANVEDDATNNKTIVDLASAGGIDGVFIDTDNVIQASTTLTAGTETIYTATEDCVIDYLIYSKGNSIGYVKINDINVLSLINGSTQDSVGMRNTIFVKKGQIVKLISYINNGSYTVYGIQTGTTHSKFQPVIYSTEEREIGVWTDGKPLYEKTVHINALPSTAYSNTDYPHGISNVDKIIDWNGVSRFATGNTFKFDRFVTEANYNGATGFSATVDTTSIKIIVGTDRSALDADFTIRYTKTTDTAGSGSWTPQGVPTHHYSTDEQIIGTWVDGRTIFAKTFTGLSVTLNSNDWIAINDAVLPVGSDIINYQAYRGDYLLPFAMYAATTDASTGKIRVTRAQGVTETLGRLYVEYVKASS